MHLLCRNTGSMSSVLTEQWSALLTWTDCHSPSALKDWRVSMDRVHVTHWSAPTVHNHRSRPSAACMSTPDPEVSDHVLSTWSAPPCHFATIYLSYTVGKWLMKHWKKKFFFSITTCVRRHSSGTLKALHNHPHKYIHIQTMEGNLLVNWSWTGQENNVLDEAKRKKLSNGKKEVLSLNTTFSLWKTRKGSLKDKTASLDTCLTEVMATRNSGWV